MPMHPRGRLVEVSERPGEVPGLRRARTLRTARRTGMREFTLLLALDGGWSASVTDPPVAKSKGPRLASRNA
jgi:hypothetical protein